MKFLSKNFEASQKIKNKVTMWPRNPSSANLPQYFESIYSQRYMHPYVHCRVIHSDQDMKTEVSSARQLDKEDVVHTYDPVPLSRK